MSINEERREEVRANLAEVRERIDRATVDAGRTDQVLLVVITKTFPASDVDILVGEGIRDVGENRDQEARAKHAEVQSPELRWHMVGRLQSNKAASVAQWADVVESVDRESLVPRLARGAREARASRSPLELLIQVSLDAPDAINRGGARPSNVPRIAQAIAQVGPEVRLGGLMAVAPHPDSGVDPALAFDELAKVSQALRVDHPEATVISAGMSGDLEAAIQAGATQVRIGGAVLGQRTLVQ